MRQGYVKAAKKQEDPGDAMRLNSADPTAPLTRHWRGGNRPASEADDMNQNMSLIQ